MVWIDTSKKRKLTHGAEIAETTHGAHTKQTKLLIGG